MMVGEKSGGSVRLWWRAPVSGARMVGSRPMAMSDWPNSMRMGGGREVTSGEDGEEEEEDGWYERRKWWDKVRWNEVTRSCMRGKQW